MGTVRAVSSSVWGFLPCKYLVFPKDERDTDSCIRSIIASLTWTQAQRQQRHEHPDIGGLSTLVNQLRPRSYDSSMGVCKEPRRLNSHDFLLLSQRRFQRL